MTFEEANDIYNTPHTISDARFQSALKAFGLKLHRGLCFECTHKHECFVEINHRRTVDNCKFFTEGKP